MPGHTAVWGLSLCSPAFNTADSDKGTVCMSSDGRLRREIKHRGQCWTCKSTWQRMALQLLLMCVFKLGTHTDSECVRVCIKGVWEAFSKINRAEQVNRVNSAPVEDVTALPSTQAPPLTFTPQTRDIQGFSQAVKSYLSHCNNRTHSKPAGVTTTPLTAEHPAVKKTCLNKTTTTTTSVYKSN